MKSVPIHPEVPKAPQPGQSRTRRFAVRCGAAAGALLLATGLVAAQPASANGRNGIKHVIMFIGDGMQLAHEVSASRYLTGVDNGLSFHGLPYHGNVSTWDVTAYNAYGSLRTPAVRYDPAKFDPTVGYDPARGGTWPYPIQQPPSERYLLDVIPPMTRPPATDSASAATAYATGTKTDDGNLSWLPGDPADGAIPTIAEQLRAERGFAMGVVTTVPFDHATPAAFVAHNTSRGNYTQLAEEIINRTKPEVTIGGGHPLRMSDDKKSTYITPEQLATLRDDRSGYVLAERQDGVDGSAALRAAVGTATRTGKRLFGLFGGSDGSVEAPIPSDTPGSPKVRRASTENPQLRDSTVAALDVLSRDRDGFFLMVEQGDIDWANHSNDFNHMIGATADLDQAVRSAIDYVNRPGDDVDWQNTLLLVTADHANSGMRFDPQRRLGKGDLPAGPPVCDSTCVYPDGEIRYQVKDHTNELVSLYAVGAGSEAFRWYQGSWYPGTNIIDNTQVNQVLRLATGLKASR